MGYDLDRRKISHQKIAYHLDKLINLYNIDLVLDVGANIGQFGSELREAGYKGKIISFEPTKECYEKLLERSSDDPLWECENIALSTESEIKKINTFRSTVFSSFLEVSDYASSNFSEHLNETKEEEVTSVRFESWLETQNIDFGSTFLKLDTQGFDLNVLEGAGVYKGDFRGISVELSFKSLYKAAPGYLEVLTHLDRMGYKVTGLYPITRDEESLELIEADCVAVNPK